MWIVALLALIGVGLLGPWPVYDPLWQQQTYYQDSKAQIATLEYPRTQNQLRAGAAQDDISPPRPVVMGGYVKRDPKIYTTILDRPAASVLTLDNGTQRVSIITADILLPLPQLTQRVAELTQLPRHSLYFSASHTHSGPGGFAQGLVEETVLGKYDAHYFEFLAQKLSELVTQSHQQLRPARLDFYELNLSATLGNELVNNQLNNGPNGHSGIKILKATSTLDEKPIAHWLSFSAHQTILTHNNHALSADYPGALLQELGKHLDGVLMFSAGAVGGMKVNLQDMPEEPQNPQSLAKMLQFSKRLANIITSGLQGSSEDIQLSHLALGQQPRLNAHLVSVTLPSPQYRLNAYLRWSPWLVRLLFHDQNSFIHHVQIGQLDLLGYPSDFGGELAQQLEQQARAHQRHVWVTSFNGDYVGYLIPSSRYDIPHYITRGGNVYGRWAGDYFAALGVHIIQQAQ